MEISKSFTFEAAHNLPHVPKGHKCARLHGHSYKVTISVEGEPGSHSGWVCDFSEIATAWVPLHQLLDHRYLNEVPGLENPTSELLAVWVWERLVGVLAGLCAVKVNETCSSECLYRGPRG